MTQSRPPRDRPADPRPAPGNRLLAVLAVVAPDAAAWLATQREPVTLDIGQVIAAAGEPFRHVYFPETSVISVISRMADGTAVEVGTVGNEGIAGVAAFLEAGASANETVAQIPGAASRVPTAAFVEGVDTHPALRRLLNRYT